MRRRSLLLAVPAGLATLSACGSDSPDKEADATASPSPQSPSAAPPPKIVDGPLPEITAGKEFGQKPTVAKGSGTPSKDLAVRTVIAGNGRTVAENDFIQAQYLGQNWANAKVFDNSFDRGTPIVIQLAQGSIIDGWRYGLSGKKAGSRVMMAVPPTWGYGEQGNAQAGIKGDDTLVFVIDIENTFNARSSAEGKAVPQDSTLPEVGTNTDGKAPSLEIPRTAPPKDLVSEYVLEGDGPTVEKDSTVLVQYKGVLWADGKEFDSTYGRGQLTSFSLQQVVPGWSQGLAGKKVGSRVLIVIPPKLGYGDNPPQGSPIKKDSTLVFTVDLLAKM
ncbi:FKBP-type peptidyl-prolyl cis-trans isomerase [Streptomyces chilikensis]|uniref:FKBP-type peptidyl-prolyl cis-trans isomerase n=1 Tax=Streptomyces chilikensis TaxID=1194079 RepID=UPI000B0E7277|nr:FKBP-type peptidyl-prolyl cis-trans isomerase [Streptomyces chilikensis]